MEAKVIGHMDAFELREYAAQQTVRGNHKAAERAIRRLAYVLDYTPEVMRRVVHQDACDLLDS